MFERCAISAPSKTAVVIIWIIILFERCAISAPSKTDTMVNSTKKTISTLEGKGFKVLGVDNKYLEPSPTYKGIHIDVLTPEDNRAELQIHSKESMQLKSASHLKYEEWRKDTQTKMTKKDIQQQMIDIYKLLPDPKDIEKLKNIV